MTTPGTGGIGPRRVDQRVAGTAETGAGPSPSSAIFIGQYVIVFGGAASGVFVYSGTPALGNGPLFWATSGTSDPYGNPVTPPAGATSGAFNGSAIVPATLPAAACDFTATDIGGITTYVAASEPAGANDGSLWINTSAGNAIYQLTSGTWSLYQFGSGSIEANSISAAQIVANTITATQLAAGIVYAGIVDSTTVNAATFTGSVFEGVDFILNTKGLFMYSGTPAEGNLIIALVQADGTDGYGNAYSGPGLTISGAGFVTINGEGLLAAGDVSCSNISCLSMNIGADNYPVQTGTEDFTIGRMGVPTGYPLTVGNTAAENEACQTCLNSLIDKLETNGFILT